MSTRTNKHASQPPSNSTQQPTATIYEIACTPNREMAMLNVRGGRRAPPMTITKPDPPLDPLDSQPSLARLVTKAILTHYFQNNGHSPHQARSLAATHATALSRIVSARLSAAPTTKQTATLTAKEISGHVLSHIVSPRADRWVERYSIPRSNGTGTWTVALDKTGAWGCSCPRYRFKRESCKHIDEVQAHPDWYPYTPGES